MVTALLLSATFMQSQAAATIILTPGGWGEER